MGKPKINIDIFKDSFTTKDLKSISKDILIKESLEQELAPKVGPLKESSSPIKSPERSHIEELQKNEAKERPQGDIKSKNQGILEAIDDSTAIFKDIMTALKELRYDITAQSKANLINLNVILLHKFLTREYHNNTQQLVDMLERVLDEYSKNKAHILIQCHSSDCHKINQIYGPELGNYISPNDSVIEGDFQVLLENNDPLSFKDIISKHFLEAGDES